MPASRPLALAAALLTFAASAAAAAPADPAAPPAGGYTIEPTHARVLFAVEHFGISTWYGDFTHVSGVLTLDPKTPAASRVEVSVPTDSLSTTNAGLDATLKGPDWFDVARFPTMTFRSTKVTLTGSDRASVEGELSLHGVTRPVTLEARFKGAFGPNAIAKSYMIGFEVRGRIKRSDFGISRYAGTIGDDVDLIISAPFERKGG